VNINALSRCHSSAQDCTHSLPSADTSPKATILLVDQGGVQAGPSSNCRVKAFLWSFSVTSATTTGEEVDDEAAATEEDWGVAGDGLALTAAAAVFGSESLRFLGTCQGAPGVAGARDTGRQLGGHTTNLGSSSTAA